MAKDHSSRIYLSALLGVFLEYFDYTLYGFSASTLATIFFPKENPTIALLLSWGIFALSFLVRPFGAILFGHFADRIGRRMILIFTMVLIGIATTGIGLLPTYQTIGIFAPAFLILLRVLQGLGVSTEYSGCSTYVLEFFPQQSGLNSGIVTSASGFGVFAASLLVWLCGSHWRFPFIFAGIIVSVLGIYIRKNLNESPEFLFAQQAGKIQKVPFITLMQHSAKKLFLCICLSAYAGIAIIVTEIYLPSYGQIHLGISKKIALAFSTYLALTEACLAIFFGWMSDFLSRPKSILLAGILMLIGVFPAMLLMSKGSFFGLFLSVSLLAILVASIDGPIAAFLVENFSTEVRYTGVSLSYNFGAAVVGGLSPGLIELLQHYWPIPYLPAWYLFFSAFVMIVCLGSQIDKRFPCH